VCGEEVKPDFLMSLKSLRLFAVTALTRSRAYYHIHVVTDGAVTEADMAFLKPARAFKASLHSTFPGATTLFKNCSTERIYLHQHSDFQDLDNVSRAAGNLRALKH
jgi:UDP-xylose:glucoside alpha-1,3-xylosyltransferase